MTPTSLYDAAVEAGAARAVDVRALPVEAQAALVAEEVRFALFDAPGDLLEFYTAPRALRPNKPLLLDEPIDYSRAEAYLRRGCRLRATFRCDANLRALVAQLLPSVGQVISCPLRAVLHATTASSAASPPSSSSSSGAWRRRRCASWRRASRRSTAR